MSVVHNTDLAGRKILFWAVPHREIGIDYLKKSRGNTQISRFGLLLDDRNIQQH